MKKIPTVIVLVHLFLLQVSAFAQQQSNVLDENGKKHGFWRGVYDQSKRPRYEGTFDHGNETGTFTYFADAKGKVVMATREFSENGSVSYTIFYDPKKNVVSEGKTVDRQNEGEWKYYHEASKDIMTIENYSKGKLTGVRKVFYKSGAIAEETSYQNGIKNGPSKVYTEKGIVMEESNFKNGKYDGMAIFRNPDGKIASKGPFVQGEKKGVWEFYENGKLKKKETLPIVKYIAKPKKEKIK